MMTWRKKKYRLQKIIFVRKEKTFIGMTSKYITGALKHQIIAYNTSTMLLQIILRVELYAYNPRFKCGTFIYKSDSYAPGFLGNSINYAFYDRNYVKGDTVKPRFTNIIRS
jgi:hypothetical protein